MKWLTAMVLILLLALAGWLLFRKRQLPIPEQAPLPPDTTAQHSPTAPPLSRPAPPASVTGTDSVAPLYPAPPAGTISISTNPAGTWAPEVTSISPDMAAAAVRKAVRQYGDMFGGDPVGTNPEIT